MGKEKNANNGEAFTCPVAKFFSGFEKAFKGGSGFFEHLNLSRIEFLKAIRSLVEERIESLEKCAKAPQEKRATKINIE